VTGVLKLSEFSRKGDAMLLIDTPDGADTKLIAVFAFEAGTALFCQLFELDQLKPSNGGTLLPKPVQV